MSNGDSRRDLVIGAPGSAGVAGAVYMIFGGPARSGELSLSTADAVVTSSELGNQFGASTAVGNVTYLESVITRNLVVGAPGAAAGRGVVYVMAGGFRTGARLTEADALYRIVGAAGDQLGSALATGDLDNDGYREIVIGAPGNDRVYIVRGGASLSGTLDLATTPAAAMIAGLDLGGVLAAGDLDNDGIYDAVLGAPAANTAYVVAGTNGAIPTTVTGSFLGIDAGDLAGTSVRVLDIDNDGRSDLAVSAPAADGPGNGRPDSGEVYAYFGPVSLPGAHSLASANVTFFGPAAGMQLGSAIQSGDINRDGPNDLVLVAGGGAGGAGDVYIYYGRSSRSSIGVPYGLNRAVDFAVAGQVSRRILGDPGVGVIAAAQAFEVTGEGARDVVVGIPSSDAAAGKVYFTISPKLRISPTSVTMFVNEGMSGLAPGSISVLNPSVVAIGWRVTSNQPWLSAWPESGTIDHTHPGAFNIAGSALGLGPGVYTGKITVSSTSPDLEMALPIDVTMRVTGVRIAIDTPANGASIGSPFTIAGWAIDAGASSGTGVDAITIYAYPNPGSGAPPVYVGQAGYGGARPDVGALFGANFTNSGYGLQVNSLGTGTYQLAVFAHSTVSNTFSTAATATAHVTNPNPDPPPPDPGGGPSPVTRIGLNRSALYFGGVQNGAVTTPPQDIAVNFTNGSAAWSVSTTANWLEITPASGSGTGTFTVGVRTGSYSAGLVLTGTITVSASGVSNSPITVPVSFRSLAAGSSPFGVIDTPANNTTGVVGALPVTGWALDDVEVRRVAVYRDAVGAEGSGLVYIGDATFVDGARPDVDAQNDLPLDYRAGWGLQILTNMLPAQGNGTFRLHAYAEDADGHTVLIGSRTITCDNAHATKPFGTIDTPEQGGTASGSTFVNFGWALTPMPQWIPTDASTIMVYIDGVPVGRPVYNNYRADIATLFPGLANTNGAIGYYQFDSRTLANGVHTIAWGVVDSAGRAEGLGSRFFTVFNGAAASSLTLAPETRVSTLDGTGVREAAPAGTEAGSPTALLDSVPLSAVPAYVRRGFDPGASLTIADGNGGRALVRASELDRLEITVGSPVDGDGGYEGYVVAGNRLQGLPAGSFLDRRAGQFFWQPGVGFVGTYEFVFLRSAGGTKERIPVTVVIRER